LWQVWRRSLQPFLRESQKGEVLTDDDDGQMLIRIAKKAILEVSVHLLKNYSFLKIKSIYFSKAEKAWNRMEV